MLRNASSRARRARIRASTAARARARREERWRESKRRSPRVNLPRLRSSVCASRSEAVTRPTLPRRLERATLAFELLRATAERPDLPFEPRREADWATALPFLLAFPAEARRLAAALMFKEAPTIAVKRTSTKGVTRTRILFFIFNPFLALLWWQLRQQQIRWGN